MKTLRHISTTSTQLPQGLCLSSLSQSPRHTPCGDPVDIGS